MDGSTIVAACAVGVTALSIGVTALIYRSSTDAAKKAAGEAQVREVKIRQDEWEHTRSLTRAETTRDLLLAMDQDLDDIDAATMAVLPTGEPSIYLAVRPHLARLLHSSIKLRARTGRSARRTPRPARPGSALVSLALGISAGTQRGYGKSQTETWKWSKSTTLCWTNIAGSGASAGISTKAT